MHTGFLLYSKHLGNILEELKLSKIKSVKSLDFIKKYNKLKLLRLAGLDITSTSFMVNEKNAPKTLKRLEIIQCKISGTSDHLLRHIFRSVDSLALIDNCINT